MTVKTHNPLKPPYCTRDGHCLSCDLSHECVDCAGKPFPYCATCGDLLGDNPDTCPACWTAAYPDRCWECGRPNGAGDDCLTCVEYRRD